MTSRIQNNIVNMSTNQRHCSFCNRTGHNIRNCNDVRLELFDNNIKFKKSYYSYLHNNYNVEKDNFELWLFEQNINVVKAYAIRYCDGRVNENISTLIEKIISKIYPNNDEINISNMENINDQTQTNNQEQSTSQFQEREILNNEIRDYLISRIGIQDVNTANEIVRIINDLNIVDELIDTLNPYLSRNNKLNYKIINLTKKESNKNNECCICYNNINILDMVVYNCEHSFCVTCVKKILNTSKENDTKISCALCRENITSLNLYKLNKNKSCNTREILNKYLVDQSKTNKL